MGVSFDSPEKNQEFAEGEEFQYELWSDTEAELALYWGAAKTEDAWVAERYTFLLDEHGTVALEYTENVDFGTHPQQVLDDVELLWGLGAE